MKTVSPNEIEAMFTRKTGEYAFARWGRPIAPVVFGVDDATLNIVKGAIEAVARLARLEVVETDPDLGANLMLFFFSKWDELLDVPDLGELVPDIKPLVGRLKAAKANQYRVFRFDDAGAIKACFVFLRMDGALSAQPAETLALSQMARVILLWSHAAFEKASPLVNLPAENVEMLRPEIADLIRVAYDPVMPSVAQDKSHALRLFARL